MIQLREHKSKIIASILTFFVIGLLIIAGPAQAFSVALGNFNNASPNSGEIISSVASVTIDSNERVNINYINMTVNGVDYCMFNAYTGQNLSECRGILPIQVLTQTSSLGSGYGYGYGYNYGYGYQNGYGNGEFSYNISVNTSEFSGFNAVQLFVNLGGHVYASGPANFNVTSDTYALIFNQISSDLAAAGIKNNLNNVTGANVASFSGLYFLKTGYGKITFQNALDLSNSSTQTFLQNLGSKLNMSENHIALDARDALNLKNAGAVIEMYTLPAGLNISDITLVVTDDNGNVLGDNVTSDATYTDLTGACEVGGICVIYSFSAAHFTSFDANIIDYTYTADINGESIVFNYPAGQTSENATNATVEGETTINLGDGLATITIPNGTVITGANGNLNLSKFSADFEENMSIFAFSEGTSAKKVLQFGIPYFGLIFSQPIHIQVLIDAVDGTVYHIFRSTDGTNWKTEGLEDLTCTVVSGRCDFDITMASFFAVATVADSVTSSSGSSGGSVYCKSDWTCGEWSNCVDGTQIRTCEKTSNLCAASVKPELTRTCNSLENTNSTSGNNNITSGFFKTVGNVIGGGAAAGIGIFVIIALLIVAWLIVLRRKKAAAQVAQEKPKTKKGKFK